MQQATPGQERPDEKPIVLVVDDDPDIRFFVRVVLRGLGLRVLEAATGEEALELARRERPDLVLLDAVLPGMDGLTVAEALAAESGLQGTRVVIASSLVRRDDRGAAGRKGVHGYLHKPFRKQELIDCVRAMLAPPPDGGSAPDGGGRGAG